MDSHAAAELLTTWGYPALLVLLCATGIGFPIPEDLLLLAGGYLIGTRIFSWSITFVVAVCGVVGSDSILYGAGRRLRESAYRRGPFGNFIRPGRLRLATRWFGRWGDWVIALARFVPGTRALVFVTAGVRGVSLKRFLFFDVLGALGWVPLMLFVGSQVGEELGSIHNLLTYTGEAVVGLVAAGGLLLLLRRWWGTEEAKL